MSLDSFTITYDGTLKDKLINPVYALLIRYKKLSKDDILSDINSWFYGADAEKLFNQAVESKLIAESDDKFHLT